MAKVALIGLDGMTFHLIRPLVNEGKLPFIKKLLDDGVSANLISTENPVTPAAWVSMYTGKDPAIHGVFDFMHPVDGAEYPSLRFTDSRTINADTVWDIATQQGACSVSLNFFGMAPPREINGFTLGGFVPWKHLRVNTFPQNCFDELKGYLGEDVKILGMDISEEKKIVSGLPLSAFGGWVEHHSHRNSVITKTALNLHAEFNPDIFSVVYDGPDKIQHIFWRFLDPDIYPQYQSSENDSIREKCINHYVQLDRDIELLAETLGPSCNLILASDHGFGPTTEIIYVNQLLQQLGLLTWGSSSTEDVDGGLAPKKLKDHMSMIDWLNTQVYAPTPSGNALYLTPHFRQSLSTESQYQDFIDSLVDNLESAVDKHGSPLFTKVTANWERYYQKECSANAPDIILRLRDGGFVSVLKSTDVQTLRSDPEGTHRPEGIFVGYGPAFCKDNQLDTSLPITCITPLMLAIAGLSIPNDLSTTLPLQVLNPDFPVDDVKYHDPIANTSGREQSAAMQNHLDIDILTEQLKTLGYME